MTGFADNPALGHSLGQLDAQVEAAGRQWLESGVETNLE